MWTWCVSEFESNRPLLEALELHIPAAPRGYLHQLIRKGRVSGSGRPLDEQTIVTSGMQLTLPDSNRLAELAAACGIHPGQLLYEDRSAMVVYKPAGLATHQAPGHDDNLASRVAHYAALRHAPYRVAPVHRLDIGTSGPVLFGKGREATGQLGQRLMAGRLRKDYVALVTGVTPPRGELTSPVPDGGQMKPALTRYRRLAATGHFSLLTLELLTGRPHQIRRQLADAGWPIVGDRRYGGRAWPELAHPFLHCWQLGFPDGDSGALVQIECPLPSALHLVLISLGMRTPPQLERRTEIPANLLVKRL